MAESNGARWQLAFWVITIISGTWLSGLTSSVVANENRNTEVHSAMTADRTRLILEVANENARAHSEILQRLARIEAHLGANETYDSN